MLSDTSDAFAFGTTWLLDALIIAGRSLRALNASAPPLMILSASGREGGLLPAERTHQSGMELRLLLPAAAAAGSSAADIDWNAVQLQATALQQSGFTRIKLKGAGEAATCAWKPSLCIRSRAPIGQMIAAISPPLIEEQAFLPRIVSASLDLHTGEGGHNQSATLSLRGSDLGMSVDDVLQVSVGNHACEVKNASGHALLATCSVADSATWIRGLPSVTTAHAGRGVGGMILSALLHPAPSANGTVPPSTTITAPTQCSDALCTPAVVEPYRPPLPSDGSSIGAIVTPMALGALRSVQRTLHGTLPTCRVAASQPCMSGELPASTSTSSLYDPSVLDQPVKLGLIGAVGSGEIAESCVVVSGEVLQGQTPSLASYTLNIASRSVFKQMDVRLLLSPTVPADMVGMVNGVLDARALNGSVLAARIETSWPHIMAMKISPSAATSLHVAIELFLSMDPRGLGSAPSSIPLLFKYIRPENVSGCMSLKETPGYCHAGVHATFPVSTTGGLLGLPSDAYFTAQVNKSNASSTADFDPLVVEVAVRFENLPDLLPFIIDGILAATPSREVEGTTRFLSSFAVAAVSARYSTSTSDARGEPALFVTLSSNATCKLIELPLPLYLFETFIQVDQALTPMHLQQVLGRRPYRILRSLLSPGAASLDFVESTDLPRQVADALLLESGSADPLASHLQRANVCELGRYVRVLQLSPPTNHSQLCATAWLWLERADALRVGLSETAACRVQPAASEWDQLGTFERELRGLQNPLHEAWTSRCMHTHELLQRFSTSAALPASGLAGQLAQIERELLGLEEAWFDEDDAELLEVTPHAVSTLRQLGEWQREAQHVIDATKSMAGMLSSIDAAGPRAVLAQLQTWGAVTNLVVGTSVGMPDVTKALGRVREQINVVFPRIQLITDAVASVAAEVTAMIGTLSTLEVEIAALRPQSAFGALTLLDKLEEKIDFGLINKLLDAAVAFINNGANLMITMPPHRTTLASCEEWQTCPTRIVRQQVAAVQELLELRTTSPTGVLSRFPKTVRNILAALVDEVQATSEHLGQCARVVTSQASKLQRYLAATDGVITGDVQFITQLANAFFSSLQSLMASAGTVRASAEILRNGTVITDALAAAASGFTPTSYGALGRETSKLLAFMTNFASQLVTPEFEGMVIAVDSMLRPAIGHLTALLNLREVQPYSDHMLSLPTQLLGQLLPFRTVLSNLPPLETLAPAAALTASSREVFGGLSELIAGLASLLEPSSTCMANAGCQADLQVRVRGMRGHVRELRRQYGKVSALTASVKPSLLTLLDATDVAEALLPDLEVMGSWTRALHGKLPDAPATNRSRISQQLSRAVCNELQVREVQGRDATPPSWFGNVSCADAGAHLRDGTNPVEGALDSAAEASMLFIRLTNALKSFVKDLEGASANIAGLIDEADGAALSVSQRASAFASSFTGVANTFVDIERYLAAMPPIFELKTAVTALDSEVAKITTLVTLRQLYHSNQATLLRASQASAPPFECLNIPRSCEDVLYGEAYVDESAAQLAYDLSLPGNNIPISVSLV